MQALHQPSCLDVDDGWVCLFEVGVGAKGRRMLCVVSPSMPVHKGKMHYTFLAGMGSTVLESYTRMRVIARMATVCSIHFPET